MKLYNRYLLPLAVACLLTAPLQAQTPEELYLQADTMISKAKRLESQQFYASADESITQAQTALNTLKSSNPDWHPEWIEKKLATVAELSGSITPKAKEHPDSKEKISTGKNHSVLPTTKKEISIVEESLKPTVNISLGIPAPVEVLKGSAHERFLKNNPAYLAYQQELKEEKRRQAIQDKERQQQWQLQERDNKRRMDELAQQEDKYRKEVARLEKEQKRLAAPQVTPIEQPTIPVPPPALVDTPRSPVHAQQQQQIVARQQAQTEQEANRQALAIAKQQQQAQVAQAQALHAQALENSKRLEAERAKLLNDQKLLEQSRLAAQAEKERVLQRQKQEEETARRKALSRPRPVEPKTIRGEGRSRFRIG
ncbi:MAG: hypothetical protein RR250_07040 [Akkermansia sp.]